MKKLTTCMIVSCLLSAIGSWAQEDALVLSYGLPKLNEQLYDAFLAQDGGILSCGNTDIEDGLGEDGCWMKTDYNGKLLFQKWIGRRGRNEKALAIAEDSKGKIWIGGSSDSSNHYMAWLICLNPGGNRIWERQLEGASSVQDIIPSRDGRSMAMAGISSGQLWFGLWGLNGEKLFEPAMIAQMEGASNFTVEKAVLLEGQNAWYIYGNGKAANGKRQLFFVKMTPSGQLINTVLFLPDYELLNTGGFILTTGGNLLGVGTVKVPRLQEEAFTVYIPADLKHDDIKFETFGGLNSNHSKKGKRLDEAHDILMLDAQTCLVVGTTQSHISGAQVPNFAAWKVDHSGHRLDAKMGSYGGTRSEEGIKALRTYSGDIWICGNNDHGKLLRKDPNFAFTRIETLPLPVSLVRCNTLNFIVPESGSFLQPGKMSTLEVVIENQSKELMEGFYITIECTKGSPGCFAGARYSIPPIRAEARWVAQIPVWADREIVAGAREFEVKLIQPNGELCVQKKTSITVSEQPRPNLVLLNAVSNQTKKQQLARGEKTYVDITLQNKGEVAAQNVYIAFVESESTELAIAKDYLIPVWEKDQMQTFQMAVTANKFGHRNELVLKIFADGDNLEKAYSNQVTFKLVDQEIDALPSNIQPNNVELGIQWNDGNEVMNRRTTRDKYELHSLISSNVQVSMDDLTLIHSHANGVDSFLLRGVKSDEIQFGKTQFSHLYRSSQEVTLKPGDNVLQLVVKKGGKRVVTAPMTVHFTINSSTLYVVSIGVPDPTLGLKFTGKDARDIARLFMQQENRLYGTVNTTILTTPDSTRGTIISGTIGKFKHMNEAGLLKPDDGILIFISTHGIISKEDYLFRLTGSDFERVNEKGTSVSFRDDILGKLKDLNCHTFVLLDACHSEAAAGRKGLEDIPTYIIEDFKKATKAIRMITSCGVNENSYEDEAWKNGAFTKVLTELLDNPEICQNLDTDKNDYLSIDEFFAHIQKEVNALVRIAHPGQTQTPYVSPEVLNEVKKVPFWRY